MPPARRRRSSRNLRPRFVTSTEADGDANPRSGRYGPDRSAERALHLVFVDAYDSFTHNLVHGLAQAGAEVQVVPCDAAPAPVLVPELLRADAVVLGPGPGRPEEAGCLLAAVQGLVGRVPLLGVCLGHQALALALGGSLRLHEPVHGHATPIVHDGSGLFEGLPQHVPMTRYHSIVVDRVPEALRVCARASDGTIQGLTHRSAPAWGVQFHPESVLSGSPGAALLARFVERAAEHVQDVGRGRVAMR